MKRSKINNEVKLAVRKAKDVYRTKTESKFTGGSPRNAWKGIKSIASIKASVDVNRSTVSIEGVNDQELADQLNSFFSFSLFVFCFVLVSFLFVCF